MRKEEVINALHAGMRVTREDWCRSSFLECKDGKYFNDYNEEYKLDNEDLSMKWYQFTDDAPLYQWRYIDEVKDEWRVADILLCKDSIEDHLPKGTTYKIHAGPFEA